MPVTSEARIAANRLNAQKSTGPKTTKGKERSRANAVKHGLTGAGVALPVEDAIEVEHRFLAIQSEMAPQTVIGVYLAHQIALMTVRCQRAARQETAALAIKVRHAAEEFDEKRNGEADHLMGWIGNEPVSYRRKLMAMPEGVDRLIDALLGLRSELDREGQLFWDYNHMSKIEAYFGRRELDLPPSRGYVLSKAIGGDYKRLDPQEIAHLSTDNEKRNWACDEMIVYIDAEVVRLRAHRETLDHEAIALDRAEAADRALFDPSKEATLARKYEAAATREFYRALREFREVEATGESEAIEPAESTEEAIRSGDSAPAPRPKIEPKPEPENDLSDSLGSFGESTPDDPSPADPVVPASRPGGRNDRDQATESRVSGVGTSASLKNASGVVS